MSEMAYWIHQELSYKEIAYEMGIATESAKLLGFNLAKRLGVRGKIGVALWVERKLQEAHA